MLFAGGSHLTLLPGRHCSRDATGVVNRMLFVAVQHAWNQPGKRFLRPEDSVKAKAMEHIELARVTLRLFP